MRKLILIALLALSTSMFSYSAFADRKYTPINPVVHEPPPSR